MTEFLASNWLWIAFIVAMLAMHRHGGCGRHGHHQHRSPEGDAEHAHHTGGGRSTS
jgi:hypothetical protein